MINTETQELIASATKASTAYRLLLQKLEADQYISKKGQDTIADKMIPELAAFCLAVLEAFWESPKEELYSIFLDICSIEDDGITYLRNTEQEYVKEWMLKKEDGIIPGGYDILCQFDAMALEYDGALYSRMKVQNPGRLTTYYLDLMDSFFEIILYVCNVMGNKPLPTNWELILSELKSAMLERQMEILL